MPEGFDVKWAHGPDFAEVAETLGVPTSHIVAMMQRPGTQEFIVTYTPELPEQVTHETDADVYEVVLKRDAIGILQRDTVPRLLPGYWADVKRQMERKFGRD